MKFAFPPESRPLEGFTIKRAIYRGGFGEVYYGLSDAGREVALKLLQHNTEIELRGVQQCLNLSHPNLVTIFDVRRDGEGDHWIIMEYVSGATLEQTMRSFPRGMPVETVRHWLHGIAAGTSFLHERGLVHRDLKPANIFLEGNTVKIGDVGLSKFIAPSVKSAHTQSVGTVYYMAPEVAKGRYGKPVDIYATGVMLYEMLTGSVPFDGESTGEILMKHLTELPDLTQLPPRLQPVIGRALHKDANLRFQSMEELQQAFDAAVTGRGAKDQQSSPETSTQRREQCYRDFVLASKTCRPAKHWSTNDIWTLGVLAIGIGMLSGLLPILIPLGCLAFVCYVGYRGLKAFALSGASGLFWFANQMEQAIGDWPFVGRAALGGGLILSLMSFGLIDQFGERAYPAMVTAAILLVVAWVYRRRPLNRGGDASRTSAWDVPEVVIPGTPRPAGPGMASAAFLAVPFTGVLTAILAAFKPELFHTAPGVNTVDPAAVGLFAGVTVLGAWGLAAVQRLSGKHGPSMLLSLAGGALVGLAAWNISEYLMIDLPQQAGLRSRAMIHEIGRHALSSPEGPTKLGYAAFFASLFWMRNWRSMMRPNRVRRLRIGSILKTLFVAWLATKIFVFPLPWALAWGAMLACTVQLASPWNPESRKGVLETG